MTEQSGKAEIPTYYANIATVHINVDEVSLEFRRLTFPHREVWRESEGGKKSTRPVTDDDIFSIEPIARVVLAFTGAKSLKENLDKLLPQIEKLRVQR